MSERPETGLFECFECGRTFVDDIAPLGEPCLHPVCCDRDAFLVEPIEVDFVWIAGFVAAVEERYGRYGLNDLQSRVDEAISEEMPL